MSTSTLGPLGPAGVAADGRPLGEVKARRKPVPHHAPPVTTEARLFVVEEHKRHLSLDSRAPTIWPPAAPIPRVGEVIYLTPQSAWGVAMVIYSWKSSNQLLIEIWIQLVHASGVEDRDVPVVLQ